MARPPKFAALFGPVGAYSNTPLPRTPRPVDVRYGSGNPRPDAPRSAQALARQAERDARLRRTFTPVNPGDRLKQLTPALRYRARRRLDPAFDRALRVARWQILRLGPTPSDAAIEAVAARLRGKAAARG